MEPNVKNPWHWHLSKWGKGVCDCYLLIRVKILPFSFKPLLPHFPAKYNSNKLIQIFFFAPLLKSSICISESCGTQMFSFERPSVQNGMMDFILDPMYDVNPCMIYCLKNGYPVI